MNDDRIISMVQENNVTTNQVVNMLDETDASLSTVKRCKPPVTLNKWKTRLCVKMTEIP